MGAFTGPKTSKLFNFEICFFIQINLIGQNIIIIKHTKTIHFHLKIFYLRWFIRCQKKLPPTL